MPPTKFKFEYPQRPLPRSVGQFRDIQVRGKFSVEKVDGRLFYDDDWSDDEIRFQPEALEDLQDINFSKIVDESGLEIPRAPKDSATIKAFMKWISTNFDSFDTYRSPLWVFSSSFLSAVLETAWDKQRKWTSYVARKGDFIYVFNQKEKRLPRRAKIEKAFFKNFIIGKDDMDKDAKKRCIVFHSKFGNHQILTYDKVDAVDDYGIQVNALLRKTQDFDENVFHAFSLRKLWRDAQMTGAKRAVVATKDIEGDNLLRVDDVTIGQIVQQVKSFRPDPNAPFQFAPWNPNVCLNFLEQLLLFLQTNVSNGKVYSLTKVSRQAYLDLCEIPGSAKEFIGEQSAEHLFV